MNKHSLTSGLDPEQQIELGDLTPLEAALNAYDSPEPDSERLLAELHVFMADTVQNSAVPLKDWRYRFNLIHAQLSLLNGSFWLASGVLVGMGIMLLLTNGDAFAGLFALFSPVLAVALTAYIFQHEAQSLREFELLSVVSPLELLYTRLLLILSYNATLTITFILFASSQSTHLVLWRLLLIWFGPMLGLTGTALYISLRWNAVAGTIVAMGMWVTILVLGWRDTVMYHTDVFNLFDLAAVVTAQSDALLVSSIVVLVIGVVLIWQAGNWMKHELEAGLEAGLGA